uniref:Uncharacterized protein ycf33 n=1 Tax=Ectocarpus siliculosus TaxID=2880 RepID=D1J6Z8_ECTSI|nr:Chloroplast conserved hypothetical protein [Ectocarpus siliculosus]CAT18686.1 Chloroplast conserved hypothetical protein [Ectocarpus siliculosus]CAV31182.1 Chloroplast conserved hypothetical protein [Ectocarpus siliculosus]
MVFWDNLLRYPRFFVSSMIGLILVLINPLIAVLKKFDDKKLIYIVFISGLIALFCILKEMLNLE